MTLCGIIFSWGLTILGDGTHRKKQGKRYEGSAYHAGEKTNRGRHPLQKHGKPETEASTPQKTVRVLDEAGNEYEATYPKRAKGLVKHGRARFTDDSQTAILLTCPPNHDMNLEDNTMNEQINNTENTATETAATEVAAEKYTYEYALRQIEIITNQIDHIHLAISELGRLENEWTPCGGSAKSVAEGIADVVKCRETTAQRLIDFYEKMYLDLKPRSQAQTANRVEFMEWVRSCIAASEPGIDLPDFEKLWKIFG